MAMSSAAPILTIAYTQSIPRLGVPELVFFPNKLPKIGRSIKKTVKSFKHGNAEDSLSNHCDDADGLDLLQFDRQEVAMIGLDSMERANAALKHVCRYYFMFHGMDADSAESIFKYLPVLSFTESYIYQLDNINEKLQQFPSAEIPDFGMRPDLMANKSDILRLIKPFETDLFGPLAFLLESRGLLTDRIREELKLGGTYWALERKLCCALTMKQEIQVEDVMKAMHLRSFDFRVLNLLLYQVNGKEINEMHMQFLAISEFLVEIADDLETYIKFDHIYDAYCCRDDYEDDVLENTFNILRMFVRIYGASQAPTFLAKLITEAEEKYKCLLNALDPQLALKYQKEWGEAAEKGEKLHTPLGTWRIPHVIEDEDLHNISKNTPPAN